MAIDTGLLGPDLQMGDIGRDRWVPVFRRRQHRHTDDDGHRKQDEERVNLAKLHAGLLSVCWSAAS